MRRRLVGMVVATTSIVLIALLLPMAALIKQFALEDALAVAGLEVQATESVVALKERADLVDFVDALNDNDDGARTTVLFADGDAIGPDQRITGDVVAARESGRAITNDTAQGVEILVPVTVGVPVTAVAADDPEIPAANAVTVIRVVIDDSALLGEVHRSWVILGLLGFGLLVLSGIVADRLGRALVRPITALARTAGELEAGHLQARAAPQGPAEIRDVGHALNSLAGRIGELLTAERQSAADLSHRLRTPLMVLRLDAEDLRDEQERARIGEGVDALVRAVDGLITEARRPVREGLGATCDATAIVQDRTSFWSALAEEQGRPTSVRVPGAGLLVKVSPGDLEAAVDALLENVFSHTAEGTAFSVVLTENPEGGAVLTVADRGPGFSAAAAARRAVRPGSTGLGLDIAHRTAEASGGWLDIGDDPHGGGVAHLHLGPPNT